MNRLRSVAHPSRSGTGAHDASEIVTEPESSREGGYIDWRHRRKKDRGSGTPPTRQNSGGHTPKSSAARLFDARHFRTARSSRNQSVDIGGGHSTDTGRNKSTPMLDRIDTNLAPKVTRSNSAPISPRSRSPKAKADGPYTADGRPLVRTSSPEGLERLSSDLTDSLPVSPLAKRPRVKRFLTAPIRRHSLDGADNYTDSEATMLASPRLRARQRLFGLNSSMSGRVPEEGIETPPSANSASRMRRLNAQHLRIRIPPEMKQHLKHGFHAGSWQDALRYGTLDSDDMHDNYFDAGHYHRNSDPIAGLGKEPKMRAASLDGHTSALHSGVTPTPVSTRSSNGRTMSLNGHSFLPTPEAAQETREQRKKEREERKRRKKYKRYQPQTLPPPTPGGPMNLMVPGEKKALGRENWGTANNGLPPPDPETNPFDRLNAFDRIDEETRSFTSPNNAILEKQSPRSWAPWWFGCCRRRRAHAPVDDLDWRTKMRRMLFLDARITIYIRLVNLGMAATLLGLAITIRLMLINLNIDGVIGPSTTLIIAYACLTIVHALMAIYKEYFGRPIGLWGLRSKMLWVCLDLLFIALWSSATTLAINDYINTPLDCTPMTPWWTSGSDYYNYQYSYHPQRLATTTGTGTSPRDLQITDELRSSPQVKHICERQIGCFTVSILCLLLYCGNMILSLFRIFETVRRTATPIRSISMSVGP